MAFYKGINNVYILNVTIYFSGNDSEKHKLKT